MRGAAEGGDPVPGERGGASLGAVQQLRLSTHRKSLGDRKWTRAWTQWVGEGTNASRGFLELLVVTAAPPGECTDCHSGEPPPPLVHSPNAHKCRVGPG